MSSMSKQMYDFTFLVSETTPKALKLSDGAGDKWYPRSELVLIRSPQLPDPAPGETIKVLMEEWLAKDRGLIR